MDKPEILALVEQAQAGHQEAFGELYDVYASEIYRFISLKISTREQAEELLQETFLKAWQALPKLKLQDLYFRAWLYRIARNLVADHYRKLYRTPQLENIEDHYELPGSEDVHREVSVRLEMEKVKQEL